MKKTCIICFSVSILVMVCAVLLGLIILIPQQSTSINASLKEYSETTRADYTFEKTKDVSIENLVHEYNVTDAQMNTHKKNYQYVTGNLDPFSSDTGSNAPENGTTTLNNGNTTTVGK